MNVLGLSIERAADAKPVRRSTKVLVGTVAISVLSCGVALAAGWNTSGSGTAAAKAGSALSVTAPALTVTTSTSGSLVPNASVPVVVSVTNPNTFSVVVSAINVPAAATPSGVDTGHASCTTANAKVSVPTAVTSFTLGSVPAGQTVAFTSTGNGVSMALDSDNNCQGASFSFSATVTAAAG